MTTNKDLVISFSGGRTSAYMTKRILDTERKNYDKVHVVFANTGQEHEKTLEFVHSCDTTFGFNTTWIEADVSPNKGEGTSFTKVSYETASRKGEPFESVIKKYGIPFTGSPHCTRELKEYPIRKYIRSLGLKNGHYNLAIGIRADEADRVNFTGMETKGLIYPLVGWGVTKQDVLSWWREQPFDLEIPEHFGNCLWCWKKSYKKLATVYREKPEAFDFPLRVEKEYARNGAVAQKLGKDIKFFRGWKDVGYIRTLSETTEDYFVDKHYLEISNGCQDSCEVFAMDGSEEIL